MSIEKLQQVLATQKDLELAVLVGSRAEGQASPDSDWDIAIQWRKDIDLLDNLSLTETLRRQLADTLGLSEARIDLIDLPRAGLAMRALVAEEGVPLHGEDTIVWNHFLSRVWRELEEYEWEKHYAA